MPSEGPTPIDGRAEPASSASGDASRVRRQTAFKAHVASCPACARDEREMCQDGYRLLVEALK